jgi:hypothetical protein
MQIRTVAAVVNGSLVLGLYVAGWGVPSATIAVLELALATGATIATWYALKNLRSPLWAVRMFEKATPSSAHA